MSLVAIMQYFKLRLRHQLEWVDLINLLNHTGQVPIASTALGLTRLALLVVTKCIKLLKKLLRARDYDTSYVISELESLRDNEMRMLDLKLAEFLRAQRSHLKTFDYKQHMARTVTTFKWSNLKKGTPVFWIFIFGVVEASCAYWSTSQTVRQIGWLVEFLPWVQLVVSQFKMFLSNEIVDEDGQPTTKVEVQQGQDGLIVTKEGNVDDSN